MIVTVDAHRTPAPSQHRIRGNAWLRSALAIVLLGALGMDSGDVLARNTAIGSTGSSTPLSPLRPRDRTGEAIQSAERAGAGSPAAVSVPDGPSIMALEAAEHAGDRPNFAP